MSDETDNVDDIQFNPDGDSSPQTSSSSDDDLGAISPDLEEMILSNNLEDDEEIEEKTAEDLEAVFDVPVRVSVVLGRAKMPISNLLKMDIGTVVGLDRQVGEAIDIYINDRLIARGEIVLIEEKLGVTMTEIIKAS